MGGKGAPDFELHSPVGSGTLKYWWPLTTGTGTDRHDAGQDIIDTIRWVCEEMPEIRVALENVTFHEIDTQNYEKMKAFCEQYNRAIDNVVALVSLVFFFAAYI